MGHCYPRLKFEVSDRQKVGGCPRFSKILGKSRIIHVYPKMALSVANRDYELAKYRTKSGTREENSDNLGISEYRNTKVQKYQNRQISKRQNPEIVNIEL